MGLSIQTLTKGENVRVTATANRASAGTTNIIASGSARKIKSVAVWCSSPGATIGEAKVQGSGILGVLAGCSASAEATKSHNSSMSIDFGRDWLLSPAGDSVDLVTTGAGTFYAVVTYE